MALPPALIALDIDGTLLPPDSRDLSERSREAIAAAQAAGIEVAVATGRRHRYAAPILERAALPTETILISSNGSVTRTLAGERLHCSTLPPELACELSTALERWGGAVVFTLDREGEGELLVESLATLTEQVPRWVEANRASIQEVRPLSAAFRSQSGERAAESKAQSSVQSPMHGPVQGPIQGMICGTEAAMQATEQWLRASELASKMEIVRTSYAERDLTILDLLPLGCSKGSALAQLAASRGLTAAQVMAVGDNWNDESMLAWAGWPVVMGNAAPDMLQLARTRGWRIGPGNHEEGVAWAIAVALAAHRSHKLYSETDR